MKWAGFCTWEDVPHLTEDAKATIMKSIPPWQRASRTQGIPELGSGMIYPIAPEDFVISPIPLQRHWPRCFALDVGWKVNAVVFAALDRETGTIYIYDEVYKSKCEPAIVAGAIRGRGNWIPGVIDPAARGRSQKDGTRLLEIYQDLGLDIRPANNAVEAGLLKCWELISQGQVKVFSTCKNWLAEYRLYRRDMKGNIVKSNDHAMDAFRYLVMSGLDRAILEPLTDPSKKRWFDWDPPFIFYG